MDEQRKKAFDFAQETSKQLITLATAIIGLTITFAKDFVGRVHGVPRVLAVISWTLFLISIGFGLLTLMALTGSLEENGSRTRHSAPSIRGKNITVPAMAQVVLFFLGLVTAVLFGVIAAQHAQPPRAGQTASAVSSE